MTPATFRATIAALGWSASTLASLLGRPRNTVIAWGSEARGGPPEAEAEWLARRLACLRSDPPPTAPPAR